MRSRNKRAAAMQLRLAGADRDAEHLGNFFVAVAVHRLQHDDVARSPPASVASARSTSITSPAS